MPVSYLRWTLILFHTTSISLYLTFHCRDVNSKRAAITALDSYRQIFVCKKSIEYALIWIIKFGNQTFPPACFGSLFCLCMEIQRNHAKKCLLKKKKGERSWKKLFNTYFSSYTMLLQFDSQKSWDCVIHQSASDDKVKHYHWLRKKIKKGSQLV